MNGEKQMTETEVSSMVNQPLEAHLEENTSVKLIGLGGVGGIVARYLVMFLASLKTSSRLVLIDGDVFEPSNAGRMYFSDHGNKAAVTRADLLPRFSDSSVALTAIQEYVTHENIDRLIRDGDIVILAVDNHSTRKLISDLCGTLDNVCLLSGGNDGIEEGGNGRSLRGTYGNCQIYIRREGCDLSPSLTRFHPEIRDPADKNPAELSCTDILQSVPQILFANLAAASAILNAFWLYCCTALHYGELSFDIADGLMRPTSLPGSTPALFGISKIECDDTQ
jgi:predicted ThiF/HesA family dinucleotide-utilizing enzyme